MRGRLAEWIRPKWLRPAAVAALVGALALGGLADSLSDAASALGDRDLLVRWSARFAGAERDAIPVTLIDFDAATMAALGAPDRVPRAALAGLVDLLAAKSLIAAKSLLAAKPTAGAMIDLDLSRPGPDPAADAALSAALARWPAGAPPLALALRFRGEGEGLSPSLPFMAAALAGKPNLRLAASLALTDGDGVVRRWRLDQPVCAGAPRVYPSPQLVAAAARRAPGDLDAYLSQRADEACGKRANDAPGWPRNPAREAAISFLFGAQGDAAGLFRRISARTLLDASGAALASARVADAPFAGRFVIVGASHDEAFDDHMTPLGRMPGAVVAANAIAGAPAILDAAPLGPLGKTGLAMALFAVMAAVSARLRASVAGLLVSLICLAALPLLGRALAPSSALEVVAAALALLAAFAGVQSLIDVVVAWRAGLRWRALLKPRAAPEPD